MITLMHEAGHFKVEAIDHRDGRRTFRIREGRKVVAKHFALFTAIEDARARLEAHWDGIGAVLSKPEK